jgi:hypothetical protein
VTLNRSKAEIYKNTSLRMKNKHLFMFEVEAEMSEEESGVETNSCESK